MTEVESYTEFIERYQPKDPRLGRHVRHDSRSLLYQVVAVGADVLKSVRHVRRIPILDQGQLGSCVGNASVGCLGTGHFFESLKDRNLLSETDASIDEALAVSIYGAATRLDPYPGNYPPSDTGTDGLSAAKVLLQMGLISGYQHTTSLAAFLTALSKQPVIAGTKWMSNMYTPAADGRLNIGGTNEGGHEYVFTELDVENRRVWMDNSWGESWGLNGRAYFTWDDFGRLLADNGDVTVFVPKTMPPPQPTPPTPPAPVVVDPLDEFRKVWSEFKPKMDELLK